MTKVYTDTELIDLIEHQDSKVVLELNWGTKDDGPRKRYWGASGSGLQAWGYETAREALSVWADGLETLGYLR